MVVISYRTPSCILSVPWQFFSLLPWSSYLFTFFYFYFFTIFLHFPLRNSSNILLSLGIKLYFRHPSSVKVDMIWSISFVSYHACHFLVGPVVSSLGYTHRFHVPVQNSHTLDIALLLLPDKVQLGLRRERAPLIYYQQLFVVKHIGILSTPNGSRNYITTASLFMSYVTRHMADHISTSEGRWNRVVYGCLLKIFWLHFI